MQWSWRALAIPALLTLALAGVLGRARPSAAAPPLPNFSHVFIIVMENHEYGSIIGNASAPYLNSLAQQYSLATNYDGVSHPSLPNYLALTGGDTFGIRSDCTTCFVNQPNIVDRLEAAGKSWKAYMESMPSPCFVGDSGSLYRQKHNPFIYFDDIRTNAARCNKIVPYSQFATDLAANRLPNYVWITPNMCHDMHDCSVSTGDAWLKTEVPTILASAAWKQNGVLFITFDEGSSSTGGGGHIPTLVISPLGRPSYQSNIAYNHYALLRTVMAAWGLAPLANDATAAPMSDFFGSGGSLPTETPPPTATAIPTVTQGPQPTLPGPRPTRTPLPTTTPQPTATPPSGTGSTCVPAADALVRGGAYASRNFGADDALEVKDGSDPTFDRRAFIRFDLHRAPRTVRRATVRLYVQSLPNGDDAPIKLFTIGNGTWSETRLTWNNQPGAHTPLAATRVQDIGWISFDVTAWVNQRHAGDEQLSLVLLDDTTARKLIRLSSREGAHPPELVLVP
jgi:acid phosphatase